MTGWKKSYREYKNYADKQRKFCEELLCIYIEQSLDSQEFPFSLILTV